MLEEEKNKYGLSDRVPGPRPAIRHKQKRTPEDKSHHHLSGQISQPAHAEPPLPFGSILRMLLRLLSSSWTRASCEFFALGCADVAGGPCGCCGGGCC